MAVDTNLAVRNPCDDATYCTKSGQEPIRVDQFSADAGRGLCSPPGAGDPMTCLALAGK
jgi:hypothetical protein